MLFCSFKMMLLLKRWLFFGEYLVLIGPKAAMFSSADRQVQAGRLHFEKQQELLLTQQQQVLRADTGRKPQRFHKYVSLTLPSTPRFPLSSTLSIYPTYCYPYRANVSDATSLQVLNQQSPYAHVTGFSGRQIRAEY